MWMWVWGDAHVGGRPGAVAAVEGDEGAVAEAF